MQGLHLIFTLRNLQVRQFYWIWSRIHGSSFIPKEYQRHMKCIVDLEGVESIDDAPDTSYYQVTSECYKTHFILRSFNTFDPSLKRFCCHYFGLGGNTFLFFRVGKYKDCICLVFNEVVKVLISEGCCKFGVTYMSRCPLCSCKGHNSTSFNWTRLIFRKILRLFKINWVECVFYRISTTTTITTQQQQWVTFMLLFQAGTFLFPYKVWKAIEGGLIASFGDDAR